MLSGFGSSLSIVETASDDEDAGGEPEAVLLNSALVRALGETGRWASSGTRGNVLRLLLEGSRRDRGVLASNFTGFSGDLEQISVGDDCCFEMTVGPADRYLIRSVTLAADDTTTKGGFFGLEFLLQNSAGEALFPLPYASAQGSLADAPRHLTAAAGLNDWTAPQGATVAGGSTYVLHMNIREIEGDTPASTRGGVVLGRVFCSETYGYTDSPSAPGVTFTDHGAVACPSPHMAVDGEPLHAMAANLRQDNDSYATASSTNDVISQGFTTGPSAYGYRLQGIGVNVEGSDDADSDPQIPGGPSSVSVAVHAAKSDGKPGDKLFDLVSPSLYAAGEISFFEAPAGTRLAPDTAYVMVWTYRSGEGHRLRRTVKDAEDRPETLNGFGLADAFYFGADLDNLSMSTVDMSTDTHALEIAVYGEPVEGSFVGRVRFASGGYQVTPDWLHTPHDARVGDQFRALFVSHRGRLPDSGEIDDYNAWVQEEAQAAYSDPFIRRVASEFKAVACTADVDARSNTGMEDDLGVPIRWLDGGWDDHPTLVANLNDDFYGSEWANTEYGAYVTGNSTHFEDHAMVWTGCDASGEPHPDYPMGISAMDIVAVGTPNDPADNNAPLGAVDVGSGFVAHNYYVVIDGEGQERLLPLYAISPIFTVVPGPEGD